MIKDTKLEVVLDELIKPLKNLLNKKIKEFEDEISKIKNESYKLTEFTEVETHDEYYSAKAVNEMFMAIGDLFEVIGKEYNETFATKDYVNEQLGVIDNGRY